MPMESVRIVPDTNKERGQVYLISGFFRPSAWAMCSPGRSEASGLRFDHRLEGIAVMTQCFPAQVYTFKETLMSAVMDAEIKRGTARRKSARELQERGPRTGAVYVKGERWENGGSGEEWVETGGSL